MYKRLALSSLVLTLFLVHSAFAQNVDDYLINNRTDLRTEVSLIEDLSFNIMGFGAFHGSAKPYEAELAIVTALVEAGNLDYYIIEANYSQAYFFQRYLETGDEELLKDLVLAFQTIVSQEGSIETFQHWKNVRELYLAHTDKPFRVIGFDGINENKMPIKHLIELTKEQWPQLKTLSELLEQKAINYSVWSRDTYWEMREFLEDYNVNKGQYTKYIKDIETFEFVISCLNNNFGDERKKREELIFDNYIYLKDKLHLGNKKQFAKYGYFHIQKCREKGDYPSFFTRLIENAVYPEDQIVTVMCYLTQSKVMWDKKYDKEGNYKGYTTKAGYGVGDCWRERFEGIENLKKSKLSDMTLFDLDKENSPYSSRTDLVEVNKFLKDYNSMELQGKNTLQFIDYAVLITDSKEQVPIEELE